MKQNDVRSIAKRHEKELKFFLSTKILPFSSTYSIKLETLPKYFCMSLLIAVDVVPAL